MTKKKMEKKNRTNLLSTTNERAVFLTNVHCVVSNPQNNGYRQVSNGWLFFFFFDYFIRLLYILYVCSLDERKHRRYARARLPRVRHG